MACQLNPTLFGGRESHFYVMFLNLLLPAWKLSAEARNPLPSWPPIVTRYPPAWHISIKHKDKKILRFLSRSMVAQRIIRENKETAKMPCSSFNPPCCNIHDL
jgi:hypothetical protein